MRMRFRSRKTLIVGATLALAAAIATAPLYAGGETRSLIKADVVNENGAALGKVKLRDLGGKVGVVAELSGLTPGFHGFHVHSVGECVAPFTSAGGHFNPGGTGHGTHAGDMPSLLATADGTARLEFDTTSFTFADLLDADGSAIIVHALPDNFAHIPTRYEAAGVPGPDAATLGTGDAGARVACGVVK